VADRTGWAQIKDRRMADEGAQEAYGAARLAYELGRTVRQLREQRDWSQTALANSAGMTQSAVARFEAGGTIPSLPVLDRLARALDADLVVHLTPRATSPDHQLNAAVWPRIRRHTSASALFHASAMPIANESRSPLNIIQVPKTRAQTIRSPRIGVLLHGTKADLAGYLLVPGRPSNFEEGRITNHVYVTATLDHLTEIVRR